MRVDPLNSSFDLELENIASDKSISHRSAIFSLFSDKESVIFNYLEAQDCQNTLKIIQNLGAKVEKQGNKITIKPPKEIVSPSVILDCGNSGTAMRILMGFLAAVDGNFVLSGDEYLNERPMRRISAPLCDVGAQIYARDNKNKAPISIVGQRLEYFEYESQISSAQVKTALVLAGLLSKGCKFKESELSRDHSEKMLKAMGAEILNENGQLVVKPLKNKLNPLNLSVPNDPSSCFFYAVAAAITPGARVVLKDVLLNKTRIEAYKILEKMGAKISYKISSNLYDEVGEICVEYAPLKAVFVNENISWLIDEIPALAIAFACASGKSEIRGAAELRVKESDRISTMVAGLRACGILVDEFEDGFCVVGGSPKFATIDSHGDHRIAMSFAILGLKCGMQIEKSEFIATSFPNFSEVLRKLGARVED